MLSFSRSLLLTQKDRHMGTLSPTLCMCVSMYAGEQQTSWEEDLAPPSSSKRVFCFSLPRNISVPPPPPPRLMDRKNDEGVLMYKLGWIISMSMSPTDVILSCEDMLSRVVNSTRSPEERCSSNWTKRSQLKSETSLKFSFCLSFFVWACRCQKKQLLKKWQQSTPSFTVYRDTALIQIRRLRYSHALSTVLHSSEFTTKLLFEVSETPRPFLKYYV